MTETENDKYFMDRLKGFAGKRLFGCAKDKRLVEWMKLKTPLLQDGRHTIATMAYWILNGIETYPPCQYSGTHSTCKNGNGMVYRGNVRSVSRGYVGACCRNCGNMMDERKVKIRSTCLEKYGVDNYLKTDEYKSTFRKWLDERGVANPFQLDGVKDKAAETRKRRFGFGFTMQSPEKRRLARDNYMKRTGYEHQFKNPETVEKCRNTWKTLDTEKISAKRLNTLRRKFFRRISQCEVKPAMSEGEFASLTKKDIHLMKLKWTCTKCGSEFESVMNYNNMKRFGNPARCPKCHPFSCNGVSQEENEFAKSISDLGVEVSLSDRTHIAPYELDIFIPSANLAFEFDGLFFHSSEFRSNDYHLRKTEVCEQNGIQLIHVFEDEWLCKRNIVESRVRNLLGIYDKTVYARCCELREVDRNSSIDFQEENHLQGSVNQKTSIGLFNGGEMVSLMTFGKPRFSKRYEWELLRFCNRLGYHVPRAASRLLTFFERNFHPKSLVSYADRRWSNGKLYRAIGFNEVSKSAPNYYYVKHQRRYSRMRFQKHRLANLLENFDPKLSEVRNMENNGYCRIFDCGNIVFEKTY